MKEIITVANRRGGAGKTATSHALGSGLFHRGYKILFIDLDSQGNLSYDLGADTNGLTAYEVLTQEAKIEDAIEKTPCGDLIKASPRLAVADISIDGTGKEYRLKEALEPMKRKYDYCIIDTPPQLGILSVNAFTTSNSVIIPALAEVHSIQGIGLLQETLDAVKKYTNPKLKTRGILLTRYKGRAILSQDMKKSLENVARALNTKVYDTPIRECIAVAEAQALQKDIYTYAKRSNAVADYTALVDEIERTSKKR